MTFSSLQRIDILRALLCQYVIFSHMIPSCFSGVLGTPGTLAVWCFFCVSGYLNYFSFERSYSVWQYYKKRILRLYPLLILSFLIVAFLEKSFFVYDFYTLFPIVFNIKSAMPQNGVLWTIVIELQLYLITPIFFRLRHWLFKINSFPIFHLIFYAFLLSLILSAIMSFLIKGVIDLDDRMIFSAIPFYLYGFILARWKNIHISFNFFSFICFFLFLVVVISRNFSGLWNHLFIEGRLIPLLLFTVIIFANHSLKWLERSNLFNIMGQSTYEIYLFHGLFVYVVHKIFGTELSFEKIILFYWFLPTILGVSIVFLKSKKHFVKTL